MDSVALRPIGVVRNGRHEAVDEGWGDRRDATVPE